MKTYAGIFVLVAAVFVKTTAQAANDSLELVLADYRVEFTTARNIAVDVIFRNVGDTNMSPRKLLLELSVVWDQKDYNRDPKRVFAYNGPLWFQPRAAWRERVLLSEFLIPPERLTPGRHTVALKVAASKSNNLTISVRTQR
jgi:hypothetical protein